MTLNIDLVRQQQQPGNSQASIHSSINQSKCPSGSIINERTTWIDKSLTVIDIARVSKCECVGLPTTNKSRNKSLDVSSARSYLSWSYRCCWIKSGLNCALTNCLFRHTRFPYEVTVSLAIQANSNLTFRFFFFLKVSQPIQVGPRENNLHGKTKKRWRLFVRKKLESRQIRICFLILLRLATSSRLGKGDLKQNKDYND